VNIDLSPELEARLEEYVSRNGSEDIDAVVEDMLKQALDEIEGEGDLNVLRTQLREAEAQLDRGEGIELDEETTAAFFRDIRERGLKRLAEERKTATDA
jgi:Arc/MetJ-type ribon-helix-helix transcriptional regulator